MSTTKWTPGNGSHLAPGVAARITVHHRDKEHRSKGTTDLQARRGDNGWHVGEQLNHVLDKPLTDADYRIVTYYRLTTDEEQLT